MPAIQTIKGDQVITSSVAIGHQPGYAFDHDGLNVLDLSGSLVIRGSGSVPISPSGAGIIFYDISEQRLKFSNNGGAAEHFNSGTVAAHLLVTDPHPQYQRISLKDLPNGYVGLNGFGLFNGDMINAGTIANGRLFAMANNTFKGNISGISASPSDITLGQLKTALFTEDLFVTGNVNLATSLTASQITARRDIDSFTITEFRNASTGVNARNVLNLGQSGFTDGGSLTLKYNNANYSNAGYDAARAVILKADTSGDMVINNKLGNIVLMTGEENTFTNERVRLTPTEFLINPRNQAFGFTVRGANNSHLIAITSSTSQVGLRTQPLDDIHLSGNLKLQGEVRLSGSLQLTQNLKNTRSMAVGHNGAYLFPFQGHNFVDLSGSLIIRHSGSAVTGTSGASTIYYDAAVQKLKISQNGNTGSCLVPNKTVVMVIDGGGSAITTGVKGYLPIPYTGIIKSWKLLADQAGSIVIDVWKDTYENYPPTVADTIAGSEKPTLSAATKNEDTALTTWNTNIRSGDILGFNVDSASTVTKVTLTLTIDIP
jgi:hypothetical protein